MPGKNWLSFVLSGLFLYLQNRFQVVHIAALDTLLVPAVKVIIYVKVATAFGTTPQFPHDLITSSEPSLCSPTHPPLLQPRSVLGSVQFKPGIATCM